MAKRAIGLFDERTAAEGAVDALVREGFKRSEVTVLGHDELATVRRTLAAPDVDREYLGSMPLIGMIVGGVLGLMVAIGFLDLGHGAMRFVGAFIALFGSVAFAGALGAIVAVVTGAGLPAEQNEYYLHGVEHGGTLVVVESRDAAQVQRAADILWSAGAVDLEHRVEAWNGYGPVVTPAT